MTNIMYFSDFNLFAAILHYLRCNKIQTVIKQNTSCGLLDPVFKSHLAWTKSLSYHGLDKIWFVNPKQGLLMCQDQGTIGFGTIPNTVLSNERMERDNWKTTLDSTGEPKSKLKTAVTLTKPTVAQRSVGLIRRQLGDLVPNFSCLANYIFFFDRPMIFGSWWSVQRRATVYWL